MEPHSDQRGSLGGKFDAYSHPPKKDVWERIAAEPTDRPLGAAFWTFTWMPKARVWRRISAELRPVPYRYIAYATAAAAAVAMLIWVQFNGLGLGDDPMAEPRLGKRLATVTWEGCAMDRNFDLGPASQGKDGRLDALTGNGSFAYHAPQNENQQRPANPMAPQKPHQGAHQKSHHPKDQIADRNPKQGADWATENELQSAQRRWDGLRLGMADFLGLQPLAASCARDIQAINRQANFEAALSVEGAYQQELQLAADLNRMIDHDEHAAIAMTSAQAGASLTGGGLGLTNVELSDYNQYPAFDNIGVSANSLGDKVSKETFQTPLVLGALVDHRFGSGFGFGAGVVYTRLQSSLDFSDAFTSHHFDLTRQYLGLATNVNFSRNLSRRSDRLSAFGATGLQFDYGLGKHVQTVYVNPNGTERTSEDRPLGGQISANLALGLRYNLFKNIGLYAQGTMAHYFYATDANVFTGKLLQPSMQVGVRVKL